jgi:hypothetical protein
MKIILLILLFLLIFNKATIAQEYTDVCNFSEGDPTVLSHITASTPKGTQYTGQVRKEFQPYPGCLLQYIYDYNFISPFNSWANNYNSTPIGHASNLYNCHVYAWHLTEGNTSKFWWNLGSFDGSEISVSSIPHIFDGSFIEVCDSAFADKVLYPADNHSGIVDQTDPSFAISKFGPGPIIRHPVSWTPYQNPQIRNYFVNTKITGSSDPLCFGATRIFSVKNVPGLVYSWSFGSSLVAIGPVNTNQLTVQAVSTTGSDSVKVLITTPCYSDGLSSATRVLKFGIGKQIISTGYYNYNGQLTVMYPSPTKSFVWNDACVGQQITTNMTITSTGTATWLQSGSSDPITWAQNGNNLTFSFTGEDQWAYFTLRTENNCGITNTLYRFRTAQCFTGKTISINPTPAENSITITSPDFEKTKSTKLIRITDITGRLLFQKPMPVSTKSFNLDISFLHPNTYILSVFDGRMWRNAIFNKK